jgi:hypothetical protein
VHDDEMGSDEGEEGKEEGEEGGGEEEEGEEEEEEGEEGEGEGEEEEEEESILEDDEPPVRPQLPPPENGTTLFIRNIPFSATEDELRTLYVLLFFPFLLFFSQNYVPASVHTVLYATFESRWMQKQVAHVERDSLVFGTRNMQTRSSNRVNC